MFPFIPLLQNIVFARESFTHSLVSLYAEEHNIISKPEMLKYQIVDHLSENVQSHCRLNYGKFLKLSENIFDDR